MGDAQRLDAALNAAHARVADLEAELAEARANQGCCDDHVKKIGPIPADTCVKCAQPIDWRQMNLLRTDGAECAKCCGIADPWAPLLEAQKVAPEAAS